MTSIIKVDQIQTTAGGTPTAADLGLNVSGSLNDIYHARTFNEVSTSSTSPVVVLSATVPMDTDNFKYLIQFHTPITKGSSAVNDGVNMYIQLNGTTVTTVYHRLYDANINTYANQDIFSYVTTGYSGGSNVTVAGLISSYNGDTVNTHDNSPDSTTTGSRIIVWEVSK